MTPLAIVGIGANITIDVILGLLAGIYLSHRTGQSWWVIVGLFGGLALGVVMATIGFRRALRGSQKR